MGGGRFVSVKVKNFLKKLVVMSIWSILLHHHIYNLERQKFILL